MAKRQNGVRAIRRSSIAELKNPGEFVYTKRTGVEGYTGMIILCPGCGEQGFVSFVKYSHEDEAWWERTGVDDYPTLRPSVNCVGCCQWHGYLTNGVWRT